ncbi:hypothetical protein CIHG_02926 [Coccidioides immitis H538.4]|uniref:Uncharacterized protein n=3 Tax=Coccidioides immitis TaxID=5501 RepID=A0A0J8R2L9_COCIT|nr:hypothetical protein CIRG_07635 [Coccidioides immitis RMSCC 2394]KMU79011.1 hypothetical protein CISG_07318 [Coccidioides immitis RMSCC 3703]KMU85144.1 hypothetical protein CIHG_02926 [Coccidioides immitis H538.4]
MGWYGKIRTTPPRRSGQSPLPWTAVMGAFVFHGRKITHKALPPERGPHKNTHTHEKLPSSSPPPSPKTSPLVPRFTGRQDQGQASQACPDSQVEPSRCREPL